MREEFRNRFKYRGRLVEVLGGKLGRLIISVGSSGRFWEKDGRGFILYDINLEVLTVFIY